MRMPSSPVDANPPQRVLNQVARDFRVVLIEIGKEVEEPTLHCFTLQFLNRTRVVQHPGLKNILADGLLSCR